MSRHLKSGADELATMNHRDKLKRIDDIAHRILAMAGTRLGDDYQEHAFLWRFLFPQEIREGTRFSTDPGKDVDGMWSFADRVDGGIRNGRLYFLLFKRREPTDGRRIFLSAQHWFDGKCWEPYRNIKPRSAPHR